MKISVVIATKGRPDVLFDTLTSLARQVVSAHEVIVIGSEESDIPKDLMRLSKNLPNLKIVLGPKGSSVQRNLGIDITNVDTDVILFLDDDVEVKQDYIYALRNYYNSNKSVLGTTGVVIRDGALGRIKGITREEARLIINQSYEEEDIQVSNLYGCNLSVKAWIARQEKFDERLALYGWLEDREFSTRVGRYGRMMRIGSTAIVHLAAQSGRVSNRQLEFAQVMNALYGYKKGTFHLMELIQLFKPVLGNLSKIHTEERRLRLSGNLLAFRDAVRYGCNPERVVLYK